MSHRTKSNRLLVINRGQFGYHASAYHYCKLACMEFDITYHCFDTGKPKLEVDGVKTKYVSRKGNILVRYLRLLFSFIRECRKEYDVIFIKYFVGCSILKVFNPSKRYVFDIRTGSVSQNPVKRWWNDFVLRLESRFFRNVSVISQSLADKLKLPEKKIHILPLGAEPMDLPTKSFDSLRLLYVGTFGGRRIEDTIEGFHKFYFEFGDGIEMTYDIVGDGYHGELDELRQLVRQKGLSNVIRLPGYIHQDQLYEYYDQCNVGISFVPINDIYDCQPPTKTFEYILAGMPVIATSTTENTIVTNKDNGILTEDTAESFYKGLKAFVENKEHYHSSVIKQNALCYSWNAIVNNNFMPYINNIIE